MRKLAAAVLAILVWAFAYVLIIGAANPDADAIARVEALALGGFLALLGLGLIAEAFGFVTSTVTERGVSTWKVEVRRISTRKDKSKSKTKNGSSTL